MGAEIDRLEIEVEAQATKANNALDRLVENLERLAGSLGSIDGNSFLGFSKGISDISSAMQGLKSADIRKTDFNRLARGIAELTSLDTSGLGRTANAMNGLADSIMGYEAVANSAEAVGNLANGIAKLGNKSTLNAIDNMPKLAAAMNDLMVTLSKAPVVSNNLVDMTTALANLACIVTARSPRRKWLVGRRKAEVLRTSSAPSSAESCGGIGGFEGWKI